MSGWYRLSLTSRAGFTLIEILLALSIMSIAGSLIYFSFASTIQTADENRLKAEEYQTARLILNRISDELTGAILADEGSDEEPVFKFIGEDKSEDGYSSDRLYFTAAINRWLLEDSKENELCEIEYLLRPASDEKKKILMRTEDPVIDGVLDGEALELGDSLTGIDFKYYTEDGTVVDEWSSEDRESDTPGLPEAVKITVIFGDEKSGIREYHTITAVPVDK